MKKALGFCRYSNETHEDSLEISSCFHMLSKFLFWDYDVSSFDIITDFFIVFMSCFWLRRFSLFSFSIHLTEEYRSIDLEFLKIGHARFRISHSHPTQTAISQESRSPERIRNESSYKSCRILKRQMRKSKKNTEREKERGRRERDRGRVRSTPYVTDGSDWKSSAINYVSGSCQQIDNKDDDHYLSMSTVVRHILRLTLPPSLLLSLSLSFCLYLHKSWFP